MTERIHDRAALGEAAPLIAGPLAAYSAAHGDPVTWSSVDFETYENLAAASAAENGTGEAGR